MSVERRSLIQILGAGLATSRTGIGQHPEHARAVAAANYVPRALTPAEYRVVDILAEIILPTDEKSPGAHDAGVARYIDIVLLYGDKATLNVWREGVKSIDAAALKTSRAGLRRNHTGTTYRHSADDGRERDKSRHTA